MRTRAPIYTTREIIDETGFLLEVSGENSFSLEKDSDKGKGSIKIENLTIGELEKMLNRHIEMEEYEEAAKISEIIKNKKNINK